MRAQTVVGLASGLWFLLCPPAPLQGRPSELADAAPVLVGAGDIAWCAALEGARATASLLRRVPGTVFTVGDMAYEDGSAAQFAQCYEPTWGREKARTRPAPGNHDYRTADAAAYFDYFGKAAGERGKGYYSYDLGAWHLVVLNSNCEDVGGCGRGSPQLRWLLADLQLHPARCTLAYWHAPRFSSGAEHGNDLATTHFWEALYAAGAEVVLGGHDHDYERFAPQDPTGAADPVHGIREFVVGTGGASLRPFGSPIANSEARSSDSFGVLKLTLRTGSYDWQFIPVAGGQFADAGRGDCH